MPLKYKNYQVQIHQVTKVNVILDSLNLIKKGDNCPSVSVYLKVMYEVYLSLQNFDDVLANTANFIDRHTDNINEEVRRLDLTVAQDNIVMVLVNTQQNEEMLKNSPHRKFEDLSIIIV